MLTMLPPLPCCLRSSPGFNSAHVGVVTPSRELLAGSGVLIYGLRGDERTGTDQCCFCFVTAVAHDGLNPGTLEDAANAGPMVMTSPRQFLL